MKPRTARQGSAVHLLRCGGVDEGQSAIQISVGEELARSELGTRRWSPRCRIWHLHLHVVSRWWYPSTTEQRVEATVGGGLA